jgi:hypothetical protein
MIGFTGGRKMDIKDFEGEESFVPPPMMRREDYRPKQASYNGSRSVEGIKGRIGMPARPVEADEDGFSEFMVSRLERDIDRLDGSPSHIGNHLKEAGVLGDEKPHLPIGDVEVAETDRVDPTATPGKGMSLQTDPYSFDNRPVNAMKKQVTALLNQADAMANRGRKDLENYYTQKAMVLFNRMERNEKKRQIARRVQSRS